MKNRKNAILGLGVFACALCCLLPIAGSIVGFTLLSSFVPWLEIKSITLLGIGVIGFLISYLVKTRNKKVCTNACVADCSCNPADLKKEKKAAISNA